MSHPRRHSQGAPARLFRALRPALLAAALLTACETSPAPRITTPPTQPPASLTTHQISRATRDLDTLVRTLMRRTGVPGVAVSVVHRGRVIHQRGYGIRRVGHPEKVDADTVFPLASLSKPLASTVAAAAVGGRGGPGKVAWDDPVVKHDPGFELSDPWVTRHVTIEDLLSHRSGLPDHAGDLLEDLGYDRTYILRHLRYEPLAPFRATYAYTNMGFTEAAVAVAEAKGTTWEALSSKLLYEPLGMRSTSSTYADYESARNKAWLHTSTAPRTWEPRYTRDADAQSPAGGASSTVRDLAEWMKLQLADGKAGDRRLIDADALNRTRLPHVLSRPAEAPAGRSGFYGLGWNVDYDDHGRLKLSHSGAFNLGASTNVALLPSEHLGIVALTNSSPIGVPETITAAFLDIAQNGRRTVDWWPLYNKAFKSLEESDRSPTDYTDPPPRATPPQPLTTYEGTYTNPYYGPLTVRRTAKGTLVMDLGPRPTTFPLTPYNGDTFSYASTGENAAGRFAVAFTTAPDARASKVTIENLDTTGLGTFTRR